MQFFVLPHGVLPARTQLSSQQQTYGEPVGNFLDLFLCSFLLVSTLSHNFSAASVSLDTILNVSWRKSLLFEAVALNAPSSVFSPKVWSSAQRGFALWRLKGWRE